MKVMVFVKATKESEAGILPSEKMLTEMMKYNQELVDAGILQGGDGLKSSSQGVRIRFTGSQREVTDGPFAETKELVAGYWIWEVKSMQEAIEWAKRCPDPMPDSDGSELEIRPMFTCDDFGDNMTPELREKEAAMRAAQSK